MKILFVVQAYHPSRGGVQWMVQSVAERLVREYGDRVSVLTTTAYECALFTDPTLPSLAAGEELINHVTVRRLPIFNRLSWLRLNAARVGHKLRLPGQDWLRTLYFGPIVPGLRRKIAAADADIIVASSFPMLHMYDALAGASTSGKPVVLIGTVHPTDQWGYGLSRMFRAICAADRYIALSAHEAQYLQQHEVPGEQIEIVGGGVDLAAFSNASSSGAVLRQRLGFGDDPVVLLLGRQTAYKRADVIIAAMQQIWPLHPRVRLLIAGAQTAYTAELRRICAALPMAQASRVTFLTDFAEADKPAVLAAADLLVQPSQRESFGIVFLEAWAAGRPVIGTRSGAAPTVISENVDGLLARYGDVTAWAAAMERLLGDRVLRVELGANGRRKAVSQYSWEQITTKIRQILLAVKAGKDL